jgi:hypothetical protein
MFGIEVWRELGRAGERPRRGWAKAHPQGQCPLQRAGVVKLATILLTSCLFLVSEFGRVNGMTTIYWPLTFVYVDAVLPGDAMSTDCEGAFLVGFPLLAHLL